MADEYDPMDPPTFNAADENDAESYDPTEYANYEQQDDAADEDDDYDPSSYGFDDGVEQGATPAAVTAPTEPIPPKQTVQASKPQQKVAGFIVEESDDEQDEDVSTPSQINGSAGALSGSGAGTVAEAQDVSLHSAPPQDTAASSTSLTGSTPVHVPASTSSTLPESSIQQSAPEQGKAASPIASAKPSAVPAPQPPTNGIAAAPIPSAAQANGSVSHPQTPARLPHDKVGQLEDRIKDDPKGDTEAWLSLIDHYYGKGQYDYVRNVYRRFVEVFPTAVSIWLRYLQMENEMDELDNVVTILNATLMQVPNVDIWKLYLAHVRRALPLINDTDGKNRSEITQAFELTLNNVGIDPDAGTLWRDYIEFIKESPGAIGGQSWQDLQKVDLLRKAYQRAIKVPHSETVKLWKEYESFEMGLHKATGRKHVQEQSPHYVEARKAQVQLSAKLEGIDRTSLPRLPPIYGCAGDDEFGTQVENWRAWIQWEKDEDPLVYKGTEDEAWRKRVLYAYRQATVFLSFYPPIWFEAASWCFAQGLDSMSAEGERFLEKGTAANPESVLLAMMKAERVEASLEMGNTDEVLIRNGEKLDLPYEAVHGALYALRSKMQDKDKRAIQQIQDHYASMSPEGESVQNQDHDNNEEDELDDKPKTRAELMKAEIDGVKAASMAQMDVLKRTISYVWVAKMRTFRRVQGQGKPPKKGENTKQAVKGFRGIFAEARPRGPLSSDVYVASALMEWNCYKDASANKIFDRGLKLFPSDESFILEYIKHLISQGDVTNARVVFESTIPKIINAADLSQELKADKCRPLFIYMHDYESKYGDLPQITKLEKRMADLYPDEPEISRLSHRLALPTFDAIDAQLLLSPSQAQPKTDLPQIAALPQHQFQQQQNQPLPIASIEQKSPKGPEILLGPNGPYVASPKRPLDDYDTDSPHRKFARAESPLKGAAGMRIQAKSGMSGAGAGLGIGAGAGGSGGGGGGGASGGFATKTFVPTSLPQPLPPPMGPIPLPPMISNILAKIPNAQSYTGMRFDPLKMVAFLPNVNVERARAMLNAGQLQRL